MGLVTALKFLITLKNNVAAMVAADGDADLTRELRL
jgi:hypothetical protein